jgi:hypothetical protein
MRQEESRKSIYFSVSTHFTLHLELGLKSIFLSSTFEPLLHHEYWDLRKRIIFFSYCEKTLSAHNRKLLIHIESIGF